MDNEIFDVITKELDRQTYNIELIASENYASDSVLKAQGSILTNKKNYNPSLQDIYSSLSTCFAIDKSIKTKQWEKISL